MNRPNTERCTLGNENQQNRYGETHAFSIRNIAAIVIMLLALCLSGNSAWGQAKPENSKGAKATKTTAVQAKADKKAAKAKAAMVEDVKRSATKSADSRRNQTKPAKQNSENLPEFKESWKNNTGIFSRYHANKWSAQGLYAGLTPQQEQKQYRTEHSKTFDNGDGTYSYMYIGDLHYKDANGSWQDIEVNIEKTNNGPYRYANTKNKFQTYYSDSPSEGIMMKYLGKNLVFAKDYRFEFLDTHGNAIKDKQRTGESAHQDDYRTLSYRNFYSDIDYNIIQLGRGVETGFSVKSRNAVVDGAKTVRISQTVELPQGAYVVADGKKQGKTFSASEFEVMIPGRDSWIAFQPVVVYDAHVDMDYIMKRAEIRHVGDETGKDGKPIEDPMAKYSYKALYNVSQSGNTLTVSFDLPAEWMLASERTFPLFIDPTVTVLSGTVEVTSSNAYEFYDHFYNDSRWDFRVTSDEMTAAGINNGATISAMGLLCRERPNRDMANSRIDLNNAAWSTTAWVTTGWQTCYGPTNIAYSSINTGTTSWNTYTFTSNFMYSTEHNNLLVRLTKDDNGCGGNNGGNYCVESSSTDVARGGYQDAGGTNNYPHDGISNSSMRKYRPAMQLTYTNSAGCSHTEKAVRNEDGAGEQVTRPYYRYSYTQILYQPSEICNSNTSPKIYGIAFRYWGDECYDEYGYDCYNEITRNLTIYLSETTNNELTAWETSDLTQVFTGNVTFTVGNWTWITFSTPYECSGSDNIVVTINDRTGSYITDASEYYFYADDADATDTYKVLTYYDDDTQVTNPANPGVSYDTHGKWRPYTKFCVDCIACTDPELSGCPSASVNVGETIPLSVNGGSVTWSVSPAGAVTFSSTTALAPTITANTAGNVTITATVAAANGYCAKTLTCSFTISNQTCTIVGGSDATTTTTGVAPVYGLYNNSWVEMIYTADEIGDHCRITSVAFKSKEANTYTRSIKVYAGFTDKDHFVDNTDFVPASEMTLVNTTGSWTITGAGWYTFTFSTPIEYNDCSKNLIIGFLSTCSNWASTTFYGEQTSQNTVIYGYSDSYNPTDYINNMGSYSGSKSVSTYRPMIKICQDNCCTTSRTVTLTGCPTSEIESGSTYSGLSASVSPTGGGTTITWHSSDETIATVSSSGVVTAKEPGTVTITAAAVRNGAWCCDKKSCEIEVKCVESSAAFGFSSTSGSITDDGRIDIGALLSNGTGQSVSWTSSNTGVATVSTSGVVSGISTGGSVTITASVGQWTVGGVTYCGKTATYELTVTPSDCKPVGTGGYSNYYTPIYSTSTTYYSYTQQLYKASEIAGACEGAITDIKFRYSATDYNQPLEVYLGSTNQTTLATAWISDADLELVYSGTVTFSTGWSNIHFTTPYYWDGESNIVVAVRTTAPPSSTYRYFYYTSTTGGARYYYYSGSAISLNGDNVPSAAGTSSSYRPNIRFCIDCCADRDGHLDITSDPACPATIPYGTTLQLTGSVESGYGAGAASWSSSDAGVATVSDGGLVTPVSLVTTTITYTRAYDGTYCPASATCVVNVVPPTPTITQTDDPLPECGNGNATLVASASVIPAGYTFHWYSNSTCTTEITSGVSGTNNQYLSYPATINTQVWCRLEKPAATETQTFDYNGTTGSDGSVQTYIIPEGTTSLTLEVWGAQGGTYNSTYYGGKGGYSKGTLTSPVAGSTLYIVVGGQPTAYTTIPTAATNTTITGGYNGGGSAVVHYWSSNWTLPQGGGGATHIATATGLLSDLSAQQDNVLIVAGGGSGGGCYNNGSTSGYVGYAGGGTTSNGYTGAYTANQTTAGNGGSFGQGASYTSGYNFKYGPSGGGGGWYGGGNMQSYSDTYAPELVLGHGGGSGYIKSTLTATAESNGSREGNGQAKITASIPTVTGPVGTVTILCCGIDATIQISNP